MASYNEILVLTRINKLAEEDVSKSISGFKLINEDFKFVSEIKIDERVILYNTLESLGKKGLLEISCIKEILNLHGGSSAVSITKDGVTLAKLAKKYS